jgi:hypothetical protein
VTRAELPAEVKYEAVNYMGLDFVLIEAVQEQNAEKKA